jgi:enoyl-CoA hydratase/carnithine racemase
MIPGIHVAELGASGARIGQLILDVPATINSLTVEMVGVIADCLATWAQDDEICMVWIEGAGDKGFCAGGDVQQLRDSSLANPGGPCPFAENFFAREYEVDFQLHTFPKPVLTWGHGIVMGGGLGVFAAGSHRVVSERTRIAMPEIHIGLFPDVGAGQFLNAMPGFSGRFLALTTTAMNAADALWSGLGTHYLPHDQRESVKDALLAATWPSGGARHALVTQLLAGFATHAEPPGDSILALHAETIEHWMVGDDLSQIVARCAAYDGDDNYLRKARDAVAYASPLALRCAFEQLNRCRGRPLDEVFELELDLATHTMRYPEFAEGVRALLIDKDRLPTWAFSDLDAVPETLVAQMMSTPENRESLNLKEW